MDDSVPGSVEIANSVLYQVIGDEVVLLNMTSQEYFGLDSIGSDVWQLLMEHHNVSVVARRLATIYEVDEQTASEDVQSLISDLVAAKLLKGAQFREP